MNGYFDDRAKTCQHWKWKLDYEWEIYYRINRFNVCAEIENSVDCGTFGDDNKIPKPYQFSN